MTTYQTGLCINGGFRQGAAGKKIAQTDPSTGEVFAEVACAEVQDAVDAIEGASLAFEGGWRDLAPGKRAEVLFQIARLIRDNVNLLAETECRNIGKPIGDARDEVLLGARVFEYYAGGIGRFFGQTIPVSKGGFDFTWHQPMGVVAAIVPWNFPFPIACWKAAPAMAAGNAVVLKPASQSTLTALLLGKLALEAGLPPGVLQVLPGAGRDIGEVLVTHPMIRKISFTGSTEVGVRIMGLASRGLKRVSLELGGKSPNIVFADADVDKAASGSPMSVFANTGQDCCARSRIFVERRVFDRFVSGFISATQAVVVGDPREEKTQVGPLVSSGQRKITEEFIEESVRAGRRLLCGGERPVSHGYYLRPAVLLDVEPEDRVWREEVFGPVVCIRPFDDEAAMLGEVNDSPYGLSGSIWTRDLDRALRVSKLVESGVLSVNSHSSVHVEAPFGGFKMSGIGRDLGMNAMEGYTELKNVFIAQG